MRRTARLLLALGILGLIASRCSHDDNAVVNPPNVNTPVVTNIQPNPTHAASMIIFAGTHFDENATFELRQGGAVKVTLNERIFASGTSEQGIQVDATIPAGTALGKYQACVRTAAGSGCGPELVEVF
jgi:hypothetical protein